MHTIRYSWLPGTDVEAIANRLACDVCLLHSRAPHLRVALLVDGAEEMWNILDKYINAQCQLTVPVRLIDVYHVIEKIGLS